MSKMTVSLQGTLSVWTDPRNHDDPALNGLSLMDRLWNQLDGAFPGLWSSKFSDARAMHNWKTVWASAFVDERITPEEIARGLTVIRRNRFAPLLPDFLAACRPILSDEDAYHEAVQQLRIRRAPYLQDGVMVSKDKWSEPAIYWAAVSVESDLMNIPYERMKSRWGRALERARAKNKGAVPVCSQALPAPKTVSIEPKEQKRIVSEMLSSLGKRAPDAGPVRSKMQLPNDDTLEDRKLKMQAAIIELQAAKQPREAAGA